MTPTRRRECLESLGWSQRGFADIIGWDESTVRRWFRGDGVAPPEVDAWLELAGAWMAVHPPPMKRNRGDAP